LSDLLYTSDSDASSEPDKKQPSLTVAVNDVTTRQQTAKSDFSESESSADSEEEDSNVDSDVHATSAPILSTPTPLAHQPSSHHATSLQGMGQLRVLLMCAKGLRKADFLGKSDPYVELTFLSQQLQKSTMKRQTLNPTWNETFEFRGRRDAFVRSGLGLKLFDNDWGSGPDKLGDALVPLHRLENENEWSDEVRIPAPNTGTVSFTFTWLSDARSPSRAVAVAATGTSSDDAPSDRPSIATPQSQLRPVDLLWTMPMAWAVRPQVRVSPRTPNRRERLPFQPAPNLGRSLGYEGAQPETDVNVAVHVDGRS